jgi:hypothetical protein
MWYSLPKRIFVSVAVFRGYSPVSKKVKESKNWPDHEVVCRQ